ncbi:MAG: PAC2 family protein [Chloroflexi bacterium]|nr:PAC2 family protein [Chloroflexota bacterium]
MSVLRVHHRPTVRRPLLLAAFGGWGDAGSAATGAVGYLVGDPPPDPCATLDPEACFDFTVERPVTRRGEDGRWRLDYPEIAFHVLERPEADHDLVLLHGPEPHNNWRTLARAIADYVAELEVETALTLGAFIGAVSHRKTPLVRRTPSSTMNQRLADLGMEDTPYTGPTAFVTAVLHALDDRAVPVSSVWAASPPYLGAPNPAVSLTLLEGVERIAETSLDLGRLQGLATDFLRKVESALRENPEVAERVGQMVDLEDQEQEQESEPPPEGPPDLPVAGDVVEELERLFRESRGNADPPQGG